MNETANSAGVHAAGSGRHSPQKPQNKKKKWIIRIAVIILLLLILLLGLRYFNIIRFPWESVTPVVAGDIYPGDGRGGNGHLPGMTADEIMEQMQRVADASYISFKIEGCPVFADGNSAGNLNIENPSYNVYPMVVNIYLMDKDGGRGELVYDSGGLSPNQYIGNDKLAKVLSKGEYKAIAALTFYDPDTNQKIGEHEAELTITIQN